MSGSLNLQLRITANADGLRAEVVGAGQSLDQLGQAGRQAGNTAAAGLGQAGTAAEAVGRQAGTASSQLAAVGNAARTAGNGAISAADAINRLTGVVNQSGEATARRAADIAAYGDALDDLQAKYDPLFAAQRDYKRSLEEIGQAERVGALTAQQASTARSRVRGAFLEEATGARSLRSELDLLVRATDPVAASAARVEAAERTLAAARRAGIAVTQQDAAAVQSLRRAHADLVAQQAGTGPRVAPWQIAAITPQVNDAFVQLSMGTNPLMVLIQQGPQVTQIFGGLRATLALIPPQILAIGAAAGALVGLVSVAESSNRALLGLSVRLRATRDDYASLAGTVESTARSLAANSGLGTDEARAAAGTIAGSRGFQGDRAALEGLVRQADDLARVLGTELPEAADLMARGLTKPSEVARQLADRDLRSLSRATIETIESLERQGRTAQAGAVLMEALARASSGAAREMTPLQRSMQDLSTSATRLWQELQPIAAGIGGPLARGLGAGLDIVAAMLDKARDLSSVLRGLGADLGPLLLLIPGGGLLNAPRVVGQAVDRLTGAAPATPAAPGAVPTLAADASAAQIREAVAAEAARQGVSAAFAQAVAARESQNSHLRRDGSVLVSPAGALGVMQLMPGTAQGLGVNPNDINENIRGGVTLLSQLLQRYGGDHSLAAAAYNAGPGRLNQYLQYGTPLPQETLQYIRAVAPAGSPQAGRLSQPAADVDTTVGRANGANVRTVRERELQDQILQAQRALQTPDLMSPEQQRAAQEYLRSLQAQLAALATPEERRAETLRNQAEAARQATGAQRALVEAQQQEITNARDEGRSPDIAGARAAAQAQLTAQLQGYLAELDNQVRGETRVAEAQSQGVAAARQAEIRQRALTEAMRFAVPGTQDYERAVAALTQRFQGLANAQRDGQVGALLPEQLRQLQAIQQQIGLIGAPATRQASDTAALRALQDLQRRDLPTDTPNAQRYIENARAIAAQTLEVQRQQAEWEMVGDVGRQAIGGIGQTLTAVLAKGKVDFKDLESAGLSVANTLMDAFLKLSLLNPIENWATGSNKPTLDGVIGRLFGNAGSWFDGGGGGATIDYNMVGLYHSGGIVGGAAPGVRFVPQDIFAGAPRFHGGGVVGTDEVGIVAKRGEGVFTREQMAALGPAGGASYTFAPTVNFSGDAGSAQDRDALLMSMRALWLSDLKSAVPGIVESTKGSIRTDVQRKGLTRALGAGA